MFCEQRQSEPQQVAFIQRNGRDVSRPQELVGWRPSLVGSLRFPLTHRDLWRHGTNKKRVTELWAVLCCFPPATLSSVLHKSERLDESKQALLVKETPQGCSGPLDGRRPAWRPLKQACLAGCFQVHLWRVRKACEGLQPRDGVS